MKRHGTHSANCSCTSCVYRSRSKQPSVQQIIEEGSRIDKLYYGKYLPLRERKLLEKLIRTRAVYDDVRNQLLSTSGSSDQTRSEHKIKKKRRDDDSTEKSSAVLEMVDLVDRGQIGSTNTSKLSSCCSCCSCSSLRKIKKHMEKHPPPVHRHHIPYEEIAKYCEEAEKRGRRRRKRLGTKISSKIRNVHFKMKKIRSEPCTCTLSLSSFMKRPSKAFIQKIRSRESAMANAQAERVVTVREGGVLKKKICSCSCKIAKLPMKSIQKIKNIRKSTTRSSGTDMGTQKAFKIKKDSLTLFREKLLKKRALKDYECELGTCVVDECIPEECFKKIKARGVGEKRRVKYKNRISSTGIDHRISISTRAKEVRRIDSKVQATPGSAMGPVICECKPITKSASSMTSFSKSKSSVKIKSTQKGKTDKTNRDTPKRTESYESYDIKQVKKETRKKRPATSKQRAQYLVKETIKEEKAYKTGQHEKEISPGTNLGHVTCECKPITKSASSMTSFPKSKSSVKIKSTMKGKTDKTDRHTPKGTESYESYDTKQVKKETRKKRPARPKQRAQYLVKETVKEEKVYKTGRHEKEISPGSNLGQVTKSVSSMTSFQKSKSSVKIKSTMRGKPEKITSIPKTKVSKTMKPKPRPQVILKETVIRKDYEANRDATKQAELYNAEPEQALPESKLGSVICECEPTTKSTSSMTSTVKTQATQPISKAEIIVKRPITQRPHKDRKHRKPKPALQIVIQEEKAYDTGRRKSNKIKQIKSHEIQIVQPLPKSKLGNVICECKPRTQSTSSMTSSPKSKTKVKKTKITKKIQKKVHRPGHKIIREPSEYRTHEHEMEHEQEQKQKQKHKQEQKQEQSEKQAVKISSSFKFEIEFSKKKYPALSNREIVEHVKEKRIKRTKPTHNKRKPYKKYQSSKIQVTGAKGKSSHESQVSYLRESTSQTSKPYYDKVLPFPRECEPSMCIPYECDPKKCAQILLSRSESQNRSVMANTDRLRRKSAGSATKSRKINSKSRYVQSKSTESLVTNPREPIKEPIKDMDLVNAQPQKQAVRITSSFNFSIEFYKESPGIINNDVEQIAYDPQTEIKQKRQIKYKERGHRARSISTRHYSSQSRSSQSFKNIQVGHKLKRCFCTLKLLQKKKQIKDLERRAHLEATQTESSRIAYVTPPITSQTKSGLLHPCECPEEIKELKETSNKQLSEYRSGHKKTKHFREKDSHTDYDKPFNKEKRQMQTKGIKVHKPQIRHAASITSKKKAKENYTTPFLKRCFCTLQLFKKKQPKAGNVTHFRRRNDYIVHMQNKTITNNRAFIKNKPNFPCECDPVLVECDPYQCENMAKRYVKLQNKYSTSGDHATMSTFSGSSRTSSKFWNTQSHIRGSGDKAKKNTGNINITPSHSKRQLVRVGSNFSFNIEFYKENPSKNISNINVPEMKPRKQPHDKHVNKYNHKMDKLKTTGSQQLKHRSHHKGMTSETKHKEKGVFVGSAIKRCFCTLKFHKRGKETKQQGKKDVTSKSTKTSYFLPNPQICECKSTSTKIAKPVYDQKSYECPPGMCNPYMCNPYECYEELKRREMKRLHTQHINTNRIKRKSTMSMTTTEFTGSSKSRSTQSRILKQTSKRDHKLKALQEDVRSTRLMSPSRQAVHLGSNFSFNVEFFKERSLASALTNVHKIRHEDFDSISSRSRLKRERGTKDNRLVLKNRLSQSIIRKEDKAANVGFILKRCFCTLGLQKNKKHQHEFGNYPPITVQIVQMDRNPKNVCNSVFPHMKKTNELNIVNGHNMIQPRYDTTQKTLYEKESLKCNGPGGIYPFKRNIFDMNQNMYQYPQYMGHFNSRIDFGNLVIDTQEPNPFYQSFYALNVKVSKLKNVPRNTHGLGDHECARSVSVPYECDPAKCMKLINDRLKLTKTVDCAKKKTAGTTNKLQSKSVTIEPHSNNKRKDHSIHCRGRHSNEDQGLRHTDVINRRDSQYKSKSLLAKCLCPIKKLTETHFKSYEPASQKQFRLGTDLSFSMEFCRDCSGGDNTSTTKSSRIVADPHRNPVRKNKAKGILAKFLCPIKKLTDTHLTSYKNRPSLNSCSSCDRSRRTVALKKSPLGKRPCPVKKVSEIRCTLSKQKPKQNKNINSPHKTECLKSDSIVKEPCNFCKNSKHHYNHVVAKDTATRCSKSSSQINYKNKKTTSGLSQLLAKCFSKAKQKTQTKQATITEKAGQCKIVVESEEKPSKKRVKAQLDKGMINYLRQKYTSSLTNKSKSTKTKTDESEPTTYSCCSKYSAFHDRINYGKNNDSLSSVCPCTQISHGARVSPVYFSTVEKTGYNPKTTTAIKSILKPCQCDPLTGMPYKCVECDKNIKKLQKRSKSANITKEKKATSAKPAVMHRGSSTKGKRLSKSYDQCYPENCENRMKAQKEKKLKSSLRKCRCAVSPEQTSSKKQTDSNNFLKKCICTLKNIKGRKELTPKPSIERIAGGHKKEKYYCDKKTCKIKQDGDMKTIMPYSKRKFKKHVSLTKVTDTATNTKRSSFCPCNENNKSKMKKVKITEKKKVNRRKELLQVEDEKKSLPCCVCTKEELEHQSVKAESKKKKGAKNSIRSSVSASEPIVDQMAVCPECHHKPGVKINKKRNKDNDGVHLYLVPEKVGDQLDAKPTKISNETKKSILEKPVLHNNVCTCCYDKCTPAKRINKVSKPETLSNQDEGKTTSAKKIKRASKSEKISNPDADEPKTSTVAYDEPLFEMFVNQDMNIMNRKEVLANISSSRDYCKCHTCNEMKQDTFRGQTDLPVLEMVIDKKNASVVNCREIVKSLTRNIEKKPKKQKAKVKTSGNAETKNKKLPAKNKPTDKQKTKSLGAVEAQYKNLLTKTKTVVKQKGKSNGAVDKSGEKKSGKAAKTQSKKEIKASSQPHEKSCKCCVCRKVKRTRPKQQDPEEIEKEEEKEKGKGKGKGKEKGNLLDEDEEEDDEEDYKPLVIPKFRKLKPCICGSVICKKKWETMYKEQRSIQSLKKVKPCVCGTRICKKESKKMPEVHLKAARQLEHEKFLAKKAIEDEKRYQRQRLMRKKQYAAEDAKRYRERKKQDRHDMKRLKKYENAPDLLMVTESLADFGKFGAKAFCDVMTTVCRYIKHPRDAVYNVRDMRRQPGRTAKDIKQTCEGMGFFSTLARIKRRAINMRTTKKAINKLESYAVTNYVIHMADKDPRQRMKSFKKKRTRTPMDFECSLFMASLRKRPCLAVYYSCPWFYPHCVSLLGLWRQFTDVLLFILAVGVWSPCILCMELCRALMCCCLCTA